MRVARHERIERPEHAVHAERAYGVALVMLETLAEMATARFRTDREHVGPVDQLTVAHACQPEDEPEHTAVGGESSGAHAANLLSDPKDRRGNTVAEIGAPGLFLQFDRFVEIMERRERANHNAVAPCGRLGRARRLLHVVQPVGK